MYAPWYLAVASATALYIADRLDRRILLNRTEGSLLVSLLFPASLFGFLGSIIWSFFIAWWVFLPIPFLFFLAVYDFSSAEEKEKLRRLKDERGASHSKTYEKKEAFSSREQIREQKRLKTIFLRHYQQAKGTDFQRTLIAVTLSSLEADSVRAECNRRPKNERLIFLITYECFILWIIKSALESVLSERETEDIIAVIKNYIAAHGPYEAEPFERIWNSILFHMPYALVPSGRDGLIFPVAELMLSAHFAGYPINSHCSPVFAVYVMAMIPEITEGVKTQLQREQLDGVNGDL